MTIGKISAVFISLSWLFVGCTMLDSDGAKKPAPSGLISTPVSYYSTPKAKYLATKYKENLDRIIEQIVRNPKTASLQFANNIASVGGIGFFTHSATKTADERYLEVVLATPETFETKGDYSEKVQRLFSLYGFDLLRILNGDGELYQDGELTGYGLNLAWRNVVADPTGNRVMLARAIIYLPKDKVRTYITSEIKQNELLADAVIFGEEEDQPLTLVSYRAPDTRPDVRPTIREDNLTVTAGSKSSQAAASANSKLLSGPTNPQLETAKSGASALVESIPIMGVELPKQQPEVALSPEPLKNNGSTSSEVASVVREDKSPSSTSSLTTSPKDRLQSSRPATQINEATASTPNTPDQKIESKQATTNSRTKAAERAAQKQATVTTVKPAVLPEETVKARIEEPEKNLPQTDKPPVVAQLTKDSSLEQAKTPAAQIPAAQQQLETPKIISELKEKPADPVSVIPAKDASVPRTNEKDATPIPQAITKNESPRETSARITKLAAEPVQTSKSEAATSESTASKEAVEKIASTHDTAKAQIETGKPKPQAPIPPATAVEKSLSVANREFVSNSATKSSSEKVSATIEKTALPVVTAKTAIEKPIVPEKKSVPVPSIQPERESTASRVQPLEDRVPLSPRLEPAQNTVPKPVLGEEKQPDRSTESEARTAAKPSEVPPSPQSKTTSPVVAAPEPSREKQPPEQLALARKPTDVIVATKPAMRAVKPLEGFVIQIAFNDKDKAQHWAESMERRGYAVSITETGTEGALRVRLGNFVVRDDAERQLRSFKQEGMNGIIINLPQGFQPARSSVP
ncbi:MAG TPA: SPOR domain-containing protein [Candidatus Binatia bacterium]